MKKGMSSVLSGVLITMIIVVAIAIIGVIVINMSNKIGESVSVKECAFSSPNDVAGYNSCLNKNLGARAQVYTLNESEKTIKNGVVYSLTDNTSINQNSTNTSINNSPVNCNTQIINGLVGYYCFENNASDSSGNGNDAFDSSSVSYGSISDNKFVLFDDILIFNGVENTNFPGLDVVGISGSNSLSLQGMSVSVWLKPKNNTNNIIQTIFKKGTQYSSEYSLYLRPASANSWTITSSQDIAKFLGNDYSGEINTPSMGIFVNDGNWHNLAYTRTQDGNFAVYLDGIKIGEYNSGNVELYKTSSNELLIGNNYLSGSRWTDRHYTGAMDDFMIYNRTLDMDEINTIYNEQKDKFVMPEKTIFNLIGESKLDMTKSQLYQFEYGNMFVGNLVLTCHDDSKANGYYLIENQSYNIRNPCDDSYSYSIEVNQVSNLSINFELVNYNSSYDQENIDNYFYFNNLTISDIQPSTNSLNNDPGFFPGINTPFNTEVPKLK